MAHIKPFCAIRPNPKIELQFCSKPFQLYSKKELKSTLENCPNSFLQIIKSNIDKTSKNSNKKRFEDVKTAYQNFKDKNLLQKDQDKGFYIQEIEINAHKFTGITAVASVEDYKKGRIKRHENTLESRETIFKNYLKTTRFNAEPVLLTYKNTAALSELIEDVKKCPETSALKFSENETLKLWQVTNKELIDQIIKGFENIDALYIADGHHRSASSVMLSEEEPKKAETNYFMAFLIPEHELIVQEYNRVVTDLNGLSVSSFLKKIKLNFDSTPHKTYAGSKKGKGFCMYLDGHFYSVSLRKEFVKLQAPLHQLDSYVLQEHILKPILGIENVRTDSRLQYAHKSDQMKWIKKQIDNKTYAVGFGLNPVLIDQLKSIADNSLVMPPKSTYIYPKLRSGTTIYEF